MLSLGILNWKGRFLKLVPLFRFILYYYYFIYLFFRSYQDDSMILCEPKVAKPRRDPYERSLAELRLFPDRNPSSMHSLNYSRLGICIDYWLNCGNRIFPINNSFDLGHLGQIGVGAWRFVNDLKRDPYATTMTAFSKISDYLCTYCTQYF